MYFMVSCPNGRKLTGSGEKLLYQKKIKHMHNPVDDAKGNAEALLALKKSMG
jgi:hypothetical protein